MRINPLVIPLMVVLAAPFALGIADTSTFNQSGMKLNNTGSTGVGVMPACATCTLSTQLQKQQTVTDMGCGYSTEGEDPYLLETGVCQRYACVNGYYYVWSGWTPTTTCMSTELTATPCPTGSCTPGN